MVKKLSDCARQELVPLMLIDSVKRGRAQILYNNGLKSVGAVAKSEPQTLASIIFEGKLGFNQAQRIINSAKVGFYLFFNKELSFLVNNSRSNSRKNRRIRENGNYTRRIAYYNSALMLIIFFIYLPVCEIYFYVNFK